MIAFASRFFSAIRSSLTTPALQPPLDYSTMPHYSSANNALLAAHQGIRNLQGRQARAGLLRLLPFWGEFRSVCQRGDHKPQIDSRLSLASVSARFLGNWGLSRLVMSLFGQPWGVEAVAFILTRIAGWSH